MSVIDEIAAERKRQIEAEGWTSEHDDQEHEGGALAIAAAGEAIAAAPPATPQAMPPAMPPAARCQVAAMHPARSTCSGSFPCPFLVIFIFNYFQR